MPSEISTSNPSIVHLKAKNQIKMTGYSQATLPFRDRGVGQWNNPQNSDITAPEAVKFAIEKDIGMVLEKLIENRSLVKF